MREENSNQKIGAVTIQPLALQPRTNAKAWLDENRVAISAYNAWIDKNGLPLEQFRQF